MKFIKIIFLLLINIFTATSGTYSQSPEEEMHLKGINYCVNGDFKSAKVAFEKALLLDSSYTKSKNCLDVVKALLLQKLKVEFGIQYFKAVSMINKVPLEQVVEEYSKAIEIEPNYFYAYCSRGSVYDALDKPGESLKDYEKSIWLNPNYADSYIGRGKAHKDLNQLDNAIEDFTNAIKLDPKSAIAYYDRGNTNYDKGNVRQAIDDYNEAIYINPRFQAAYFNCGNVYLRNGAYIDALIKFNRAIELDPTDAAAYSNRGVTHVKLNNKKKACQDFKKACDLGYCDNYKNYKKDGICP